MTVDDVAMTPFLRKITLFSSGGSFLDGYVLSLIGVALTQLVGEMGLATEWSAIVGASALAGIFFGCLLGGRITDALGRRKMFIIDVVAIAACSLASVFVTNAPQLVASRFLIGFFIGADYPIATSLIAEFTPKRHRAVSMGIVSAAWYLGATAAAFVGYGLITVAGGWKWMLGSAVIPCIILLIGRHDIPESPRWLLQKGRVEESNAVMMKVFGPGVELEPEHEGKSGFRSVFKKGYLRRIIFVGIIILCQVVPMYAIYTFGPDILVAFGFETSRDAILGESIISCLFLVGTIPAMFWLNSMGRRRMLILGLAMMTIGLAVLGIWPTAPIMVIVAAFGLYAFFSGGPGILQWLYPNELFPTEVRATAVGVAIAISRIGTVLATYGLPLFMAAYGVGPTMLVGTGLLLVGLVWSIFDAPETKDMTLEESSSLKKN